MYFDNGNMITENSKNVVEIEYLDGSIFTGEYAENNGNTR